MKLVKIDNETYEYHDAQCQFSLGTHAVIFLTFDIIKNQEYKQKLIFLYESCINFNLISSKFISKSNTIKMMDLSDKFLTLQIRSELLETIPQDERRDEIIDDILKTTFIRIRNINQ
jgi:hypothetical protein